MIDQEWLKDPTSESYPFVWRTKHFRLIRSPDDTHWILQTKNYNPVLDRLSQWEEEPTQACFDDWSLIRTHIKTKLCSIYKECSSLNAEMTGSTYESSHHLELRTFLKDKALKVEPEDHYPDNKGGLSAADVDVFKSIMGDSYEA